MALSHMMKAGKPTGDMFDDHGTAIPGEPDFSIANVEAHVARLRAAPDGFNYVGASAEVIS